MYGWTDRWMMNRRACESVGWWVLEWMGSWVVNRWTDVGWVGRP